MKLTQDNIKATVNDLENMVFYYERHGKLWVDDAVIQTLKDAIEELEALKYYAD